MDAGLPDETFDCVSEALGRDVRALCNADEETLRRTENAQICLFTCGVAAALSADIGPAFAAGHSVGEYAALVAAGMLSAEDGSRLVALRGELMSQARGGTMAAIMGLEEVGIQNLCYQARGTVVIANYNCPGQLVISGEPEAVATVSEQAAKAGAKRVIPLNVSGAFHSPLMEEAAGRMRSALSSVAFHDSPVRVVSNVTGEFATAAEMPDLLARQIMSPVRWTACVETLVAEGADQFRECGVGGVLCGLLKRIAPGVACSPAVV